jgi:preprotein translocase subunit YajC
MWNLLVVLAEGESQNPSPGGAFPWPLLLGFVLLFYFFILRPMRRQDRERAALLGSLKKNDDVITSSGIYGTVVAVSEKEDEVTVKVADNVRLRMTKGSIARNLTNEAQAKDQKAAKDGAAKDSGKSTGIKQG